MAQVSWEKIELAPFVLVVEGESVIGDLAKNTYVTALKQHYPQMTIHRIDPHSYAPGTIANVSAPSLFSEQSCMCFDDISHASSALLEELDAYIKSPSPDVWVFMRIASGKKGAVSAKMKKYVQFFQKNGNVYHFPSLEKHQEKMAFLGEYAAFFHRRFPIDAREALIDALGGDVRELANAARQLFADVSGDITRQSVETYYFGQKDVDRYAVAQAIIDGDAGRAIALARHALIGGETHVGLVAAIASRFREMLLADASRTGYTPAIAPWMLKRGARDLNSWSQPSIARAVESLAHADAQMKGEARDKDYALEKLIINVCNLRR